MGRTTGQWRCRICSFDRWHIVTVKRKNGALYTTSFYVCSRCSVTFLNPEQFSASRGCGAECGDANRHFPAGAPEVERRGGGF